MILRTPTQPVIKSPLNYTGGKVESLRLYMPEDSDMGENTQLQSWSKKYRVISMAHNMYANSNYQKKSKAVSSEVFVVNYEVSFV